MKLENVRSLLAEQGYVTDHAVSMAVFLSMSLEKPLLIEGPAGVGKTEVAKAMAQAMQTDLIRLQCYDGLDANHALYEWNYQRQLLHLKAVENNQQTVDEKEKTIFSEAFLLKRPLLKAITHSRKPVLLIDEVDRSDEEFESFLLEVLSDWQITIPEVGTIKATHLPQVILTSNSTRELSEALRRRCLYLYIDYPDLEKEFSIINKKIPGLDIRFAKTVCHFMQNLRMLKLEKKPGISETLDWAASLAALHYDYLDKNIVTETLGVILKDWRDMRQVELSLNELLEKTGIYAKTDDL